MRLVNLWLFTFRETPTFFSSPVHIRKFIILLVRAVFAWLHSPTGQGLFTPSGGLNSLSVTDTPRGMYGFSAPESGGHAKLAPTTPHHQNQVYFASVELEAGGDVGVNTPKVPEGQRSIICISPLASGRSRKKVGHGSGAEGAPDTPMSINFSEVFASPRLPTPRLRQTPAPFDSRAEDGALSSSDGRQSSPVASALHSAERDINLDDDLNALLQLAESATPGGRPSMAFMSPLLTNSLRRASDASRNGDPPSSLQLPIIRGSSVMKSSTPQLSIRSMSSGSSSSIKSSLSKAKKRKLPDGEYHDQQQQPVGYTHPSMMQYQHPLPGNPSSAVTNAHHGYYHHSSYDSHHGYTYPAGLPAPQQHYAYPDLPATASTSGIPNHSPSPGKSSKKSGLSSGQGKSKSATKAKAPSPVSSSAGGGAPKRVRKSSPKSESTQDGSGVALKKSSKNVASDPADRMRIAMAIMAVNSVYGDGSEKERKLKEATLRGVTQRPSKKWVSFMTRIILCSAQKREHLSNAKLNSSPTCSLRRLQQAQLYYAGKSRYIGVFDSKEKASLAYEIAREVLKTEKDEHGPSNAEETERNVNLARKAAFAGINEHDSTE